MADNSGKMPELVRGDTGKDQNAVNQGKTTAPTAGAIAAPAAVGTPAPAPAAGAPTSINARSEKAPEGGKKQPDGEVLTHEDSDARPGSSEADPQNLAKDAQAVGGAVGSQEDRAGAVSLGAQPGAGGNRDVVVSDEATRLAVEAAPAPEGQVRMSHAETGNFHQ